MVLWEHPRHPEGPWSGSLGMSRPVRGGVPCEATTLRIITLILEMLGRVDVVDRALNFVLRCAGASSVTTSMRSRTLSPQQIEP